MCSNGGAGGGGLHSAQRHCCSTRAAVWQVSHGIVQIGMTMVIPKRLMVRIGGDPENRGGVSHGSRLLARSPPGLPNGWWASGAIGVASEWAVCPKTAVCHTPSVRARPQPPCRSSCRIWTRSQNGQPPEAKPTGPLAQVCGFPWQPVGSHRQTSGTHNTG